MGTSKHCSAESERQTLKQADEPGIADERVCEEPGIGTHHLRRWRDMTMNQGLIRFME